MKTTFLLFLLLGFCSFQGAFAQTVTPEADGPKGYLVGPGDEVTGKVLGEPQFDFVATVDESGKIEIPFSDNAVVAMCKTERDLRIEVGRLLAKYLKNPQLSLRVTKRDSRPPVSVYGEVRQQGQPFTLTRRVQLLDVLSAAGGTTEKSGEIIQVYHTRPPICADAATIAEWKSGITEGSDVPSKTYNLADVRKGLDTANPEIFPGDIIVVPKAASIYVLGEVVKPGEMSIPEGGLPLSQAVAMASGLTREAKSKEIKIYRRKPGLPQPEAMSVNFDDLRKGSGKDVMLQPFDIVEVGKSPKSFGSYIKDFAIGMTNRVPIPL